VPLVSHRTPDSAHLDHVPLVSQQHTLYDLAATVDMSCQQTVTLKKLSAVHVEMGCETPILTVVSVRTFPVSHPRWSMAAQLPKFFDTLLSQKLSFVSISVLTI